MGHRNWILRAQKLALIGATALSLAGCEMIAEQDRAQIERDILSTPGTQGLWQAIKEEYPDDFAQLVDRIHELDFQQRSDERLGEEIGKQWLQEFYDRIAPDTVRAPAAELLAWSEQEFELYAELQRSSLSDCASMSMGEWIFIDPSNITATAAITRRNTAMVRAAAAGRDDPQTYEEPSDAAFNRLGDAIADTGLEPQLQATLGSDAEMALLSPAEQCQLGVAVYQGLRDLPDDVEPEMAAYMLAPL